MGLLRNKILLQISTAVIGILLVVVVILSLTNKPSFVAVESSFQDMSIPQSVVGPTWHVTTEIQGGYPFLMQARRVSRDFQVTSDGCIIHKARAHGQPFCINAKGGDVCEFQELSFVRQSGYIRVYAEDIEKVLPAYKNMKVK